MPQSATSSVSVGAATPDGETSRRKPLPEQMDDVEATFIRSALAESNGNIQAAADALGIPRRTLNEKMRRYNLESARISGKLPPQQRPGGLGLGGNPPAVRLRSGKEVPRGLGYRKSCCRSSH